MLCRFGIVATPNNHAAAVEVVFTITASNINYVDIVLMSKYYDYDIAIDASKHITSAPIDRNK